MKHSRVISSGGWRRGTNPRCKRTVEPYPICQRMLFYLCSARRARSIFTKPCWRHGEGANLRFLFYEIVWKFGLEDATAPPWVSHPVTRKNMSKASELRFRKKEVQLSSRHSDDGDAIRCRSGESTT